MRLTTFGVVFTILCVLRGVSFGEAPPVPGVQREFSITAGNAFFDQSPGLGVVCTFDFGDPAGPFNILTGYNAAHIYRKPGDYTLKVSQAGAPDAIKTIHVLPDNRPVQQLMPGDSLVDAVRGLRNDSVVLLQPGSSWDISGILDIKARNVEFRAAGPGPAPRIRRLSFKAANSILLQGMDITFRGIEFDSDRDMKAVGNQKTGYRGLTPDAAHVVVENCIFRNLDDAIFCTPLTRGLLIQTCQFTDEIRACDVWTDGSNLTLLGNKMGTSQREHNLRQSHPGFYNLLVYGNDMTAQHGKETLTFRIGQDLYAAQNTFRGWLRLGPGPRGDHRPMNAIELHTAFVKFVVLDHNAFVGNFSWVQINEGTSEVIIRGNQIEVDNQGVPVHVQGPSVGNIVIENNCRVLTAGPTQKPFVRSWDAGPEVYVEKGTTTKSIQEIDAAKK